MDQDGQGDTQSSATEGADQDDVTSPLPKLLELYPEFPRKCREEFRRWNAPEPMIDHLARDLRRAGVCFRPS